MPGRGRGLMTPGATAFTRTPREAYSMASDRVAATNPPLVSEARADGRSCRVVDEAGTDVDDVTAALGQHLADDALGDVEEACQVHRRDRPKVVERVVGEWLADEDAGVVDQGVDPSEPTDGLLHHALSRLDFGDVAGHGQDVASSDGPIERDVATTE